MQDIRLRDARLGFFDINYAASSRRPVPMLANKVVFFDDNHPFSVMVAFSFRRG